MTSNWNKVLLLEGSSIRDALSILDDESLRIAIIVDDDKHILGVVTDGDIRRGLLNGIPLDALVTKVMNTNPTVAKISDSKEEAVELMETHNLLSMPIVDDKRRIVGIHDLLESLVGPVYDNPVFIMAGGFGTRLRPLTENCPKVMLKVGSKPMLEILINNFKKFGFHNFYISTHYMPEIIHNYFGDGSDLGVSITYIHEDTPLGTGGALGLLPDDLPNLPVILMNGDILTSIDFTKLLEFHNKSKATATMCVREFEYQVPYGVIEGKGLRVLRMTEKPIQHFFINAGIYVLDKEVVNSVQKNQHIDMPSLLERNIALNKDVFKFPVYEYWLDIGRINDFEKAQLDFGSLSFFK